MSNFRPVKRVTSVIEVFRQIRQAVPARLLMVGDGPDLPEAVRLTRAHGLAEHVQFLGDQEQVVPLLSVSDLFLMPSVQESFGLAALEAMACEVPVVASRIGGLPDLIEDGVTGFLCAADDLDGHGQAGIRLLTDEALHQRMARAARPRGREALRGHEDCADVRGVLRRNTRGGEARGRERREGRIGRARARRDSVGQNRMSSTRQVRPAFTDLAARPACKISCYETRYCSGRSPSARSS